ncbi:MAG TPA: hypothetical protein VK811_09960, partial [Candidatus Acidoferrum sp.]|nr:hypothetical protein [Candidatus Acidoferrum sp.]
MAGCLIRSKNKWKCIDQEKQRMTMENPRSVTRFIVILVISLIVTIAAAVFYFHVFNLTNVGDGNR